MSLTVLMGLTNPMTWLIVAMVYIWLSRLRHPKTRNGSRAKAGVRAGVRSDAAIGAVFQFFSIAYRPNHAFVARAQIEQQEDADEDDDGDPESPVKHLDRQLRRIRRGERVDRLIWRLK